MSDILLYSPKRIIESAADLPIAQGDRPKDAPEFIDPKTPLKWFFSFENEKLYTAHRDRLARRLVTLRGGELEETAKAVRALIDGMIREFGPIDTGTPDMYRMFASARILADGAPHGKGARYDNQHMYKLLRKHYRLSHNASLAKVAEVVDRVSKRLESHREGGYGLLWAHFTRND